MKCRRLVPRLALLVALSVATSTTGLAEQTASVTWHVDFAKAARATQRQNRPLLLFITMQGCSYCSRMKEQTYKHATVTSRINDEFVAARLDGLKNQQLAQAIGVRIYPTTAIVSPHGLIVEVIPGYQSADDLLKRLAAASQKHAALAANLPARN
jgi:thioredoxin-related protein